MRKLFFFIGLIVSVFGVIFLKVQGKPLPEVAVIVPMEHRAMDAIVQGLKEELGDHVNVRLYNAGGDSSLQLALIQQIALDKPDVVLPIGTSTTQMALQHLPATNIVHLAAKFTESDRKNGQMICGVLDEIPPENALDAALLLMPHIKKITLVHSASEKIYPEAKSFEEKSRQLGIALQKLVVQAQSDLYTAAHQIDPNSDLIVVLKDHMVVSGIATLVQFGKEHNIPVMASDEGSIGNGAMFAVGIREASTGLSGAGLVKAILQGRKACELGIESVDTVHLFYQKQSAQAFDFEGVANQLGYIAVGME